MEELGTNIGIMGSGLVGSSSVREKFVINKRELENKKLNVFQQYSVYQCCLSLMQLLGRLFQVKAIKMKNMVSS